MNLRRPVTTSVLVAALLLGGCSGPRDPGPAEAAAEAEGPATDNQGAGPSARLPFDELLGLGIDPEVLAHRWAIWAAGYPSSMTRCMRGRGYAEFVEPSEPVPTVEELAAAGAPGTASEGLRTHGYGIAGNTRLQIEAATTDRSVDAPPAWLETMSAGARRAYEGDHRDCQQAASAAFPHPNGGAATGASAAAFIELSELRRSFEEAPAVQAIWAEWAHCMRGRGWSASRRTDLVEDLNDAADRLLLPLEGVRRHGPEVLAPDHPAVVDARRALQRLEAREAEMVADDLGCAEPMELDRREYQALHRLQSDYLAAHGDEVRQLVAASGLGR